jgi:DNA-binding transcriptional MerR regulator
LEELASSSGLSTEDLRDLERFGMLSGRTVAGTVYYDEDALTVAQLAAGFMRYGVEARHLRMYRTSAEREASFFEQVVMPMLKQRNPQARRQAVDAIQELSELGQELRATLVRQALRDYTGG